jgi:cytochrome P450
VPSKRIWLKFQEWSKIYGPIYQLKIMGEDIVVISDKKILEDLLVKRKANYSSRPDYPAIPGANYDMRYLPLLSAGGIMLTHFQSMRTTLTVSTDHHTRARRFAHHLLTKIPHVHLVDVTTRATKDYIRALIRDPCDAKTLTELYASRITCEISWGDPTVAQKNADTAWALMHYVSPGATPLSKLPFLSVAWDLLPDFLQPWKVSELTRRAREREFWLTEQEKARAERDGPFTLMQEANRQRDKGISDEEEAANSVGMLTVIGSLLLATPVQSFLIAMCHHPEWQARGAEELDSVCPDRLPTPRDLKDLPVLRAIIRETHRWRPPVPIGAPHASEQDDVYNGYFIPKNSSVLSLTWAFERDESVFPDPDNFRPERWLDPAWPSYKEPLTVYPQIKGHNGFGWGNRMCLGQDYVEIVNMIMIGSLLACCTVGKKRNPLTGEDVEIDTMDYEPFTIFVRPYAWEMDAKPRSEERLKNLETFSQCHTAHSNSLLDD